jgi:hypothetical protein
MAQTLTVGKHATTVKTDADGVIRITYWSTPVVTVDGDYVTLRAGGWHTVTTKARMNQASHQFNLGYSVFQKNYEWFVTMPDGDVVPYWDGITFPKRGASPDAHTLDELAHQALPARRARQRAY